MLGDLLNVCVVMWFLIVMFGNCLGYGNNWIGCFFVD